MTKRTDRRTHDEADGDRWAAFRAKHALEHEISLLEGVVRHKSEITLTVEAALAVLEWLRELREHRSKGAARVIYSNGPVADDCHAIFNLAHRAAEESPKHVHLLPPELAENCLKWLRDAARIVDTDLEPALIRRANLETPTSRSSDDADTELDEHTQSVED